MMGESQNQFSLTRAALNTCRRAIRDSLSAKGRDGHACLLLRLRPADHPAVLGMWHRFGRPELGLIGSLFVCFVYFVVNPLTSATAAGTARAMRFEAQTPTEARAWQGAARAKLFALLMNGRQPERGPLDAKVIRTIDVPANRCVLEELFMI